MSKTFEDPRKTDLRERVTIAVEASGFQLLDEPALIAAPESAGLKGGILGDVQGLDADGVRHAFYVRLAWDKPVPEWIANLASLSHSLGDVQVHVVVEQISTNLERSCRACGAGLLQLNP